MKVIVTGSEGFIGKQLCRRLESFSQVVRIDRENGDDAADIERFMTEDIDVVFHLAAETSVFNNRLDVIERENVRAFMKVALACHRHDVKLVYASSSTANPCNTTSMYGMTKHFNEQFAMAYCPKSVGVRLHNVYGPEPRKGTLLYNILNGPCTIYNGGRNMRHFTFISDALDGFVKSIGEERQLVNIRNPERNTVREFCEEVAKYERLDLHYAYRARPRDNFEQSVDENIFSLPLHYKTIRQGIASLFDE